MTDSFYKEHWKTIAPDRFERYLRTFEWNDASMPLFEGADIQPGHRVADFGCGPGHTALEMARWVGPDGTVHGFDINAGFISHARKLAAERGLADRVHFLESDGTALPVSDRSLDRVVTRNTLIYADDPLGCCREFRRALKPGGRVHAIEGDWPMMIVEPIPSVEWSAFVEAASCACRTADIGRKLYGIMRSAGLRDLVVEVITRPDIDGRLFAMLQNMAGYATSAGGLPEEHVASIVARIEEAIRDKRYLAVAPQFVVSGVA